ncbi:MAG: hypothetical protein ACFFFT_04955 [Candidatus Thorarchaeota archaeon]
MIKPYLECPRFDFCSVNACPLDSQNRESIPDDPETECKSLLFIRKRIAEKYNLPNHGMTEKEMIRERRRIAAKKRWENLSDEEKHKRMSNLMHYSSKMA